MAAAAELTPTQYIGHHLSFNARSVGEGAFWTLNVDTLVTSVLLGILGIGFLWWGGRGAIVELAVGFVDEQVKGVFHGDRRFIAPLALTVFVWVLLMNSMDFLPVDWVALGTHYLSAHGFRIVPTADVNTTFALALSVWGVMF